MPPVDVYVTKYIPGEAGELNVVPVLVDTVAPTELVTVIVYEGALLSFMVTDPLDAETGFGYTLTVAGKGVAAVTAAGPTGSQPR